MDFAEDSGYAEKEGIHLLVFNDYVGGADETVESAKLVKISEVK